MEIFYCMTSAEFTTKFPKPWKYVAHKTTFSLHAANGAIVGQLRLDSFHVGIPQMEWNRHVAASLNAQALPVIIEP